MASELKGNAIVSGYIDFFCLVCECHMRSEQDARIHIDEPPHRENLALYPYLEQYKEDRIRKIKKLYFCELCHLPLATMTKVTLHSMEGEHIYKKGEQHIKRIKNHVVVSDGMLITELGWNGILADNTCTVCNTEVDDVTVHLSDQKHLVNLIGLEAQFSEGIVYRKIDETFFHCLVCNMIFALTTLSTHSANKMHKKQMLSCRADFELHVLQKDLSEPIKKAKFMSNEEGKSAEILKVDWKWDPQTITCDNKASYDKVPAETNKETSAKDKDAILKQLPEFQKSGMKINFESEIVSCNECSETMKFDIEIIKHHIVSHKNNATKNKTNEHVIQPSHSKTDIRNKVQKKSEQSKHATPEIESDDEIIKIDVRKRSDTESNESWSTVHDDREEAVVGLSKLDQSSARATGSKSEGNFEEASFAEQNNINYNAGRSIAFCRTCRLRLPSTLKSMIKHVNGDSHKTKSKRRTRQDETTSFGNPIKTLLPQITDEVFFGKERYSGEDFDAIINDELCVSNRSFHLITGIKNLRCQVCEKKLSESEVNDHVATSAHKNWILTKPVITNWKNELIREVRSGIFHCGFCNSVVGSWSDLNIHLQGQDHVENRNVSERRLAMHLPPLRAWRTNRNRPLSHFFEQLVQQMLFDSL